VQQQQSAGKLQARWRGLKARVAVAPALFASRAAHRAARKEAAAMSTEDARSHTLRAWTVSKYCDHRFSYTIKCNACHLVIALVD
jgi:septal ring factor EnvC (AmiA/AmiB activator)